MKLRNFILISSSLHIGLFVLFLFFGQFLDIFRKAKRLAPSPPQSIRVNMATLPDMYHPSPEKESSSEESTKTTAIKKNVKKPTKKKAKKKKQQKKNQKTTSQPVSSPKKEIEKQAEKSSPPKESSSISGSASGKQEGEELSPVEVDILNTYLADLTERIRKGWNLPRRLAGRGFSAEVEIRIGKKGRITYKALVSSSGNEEFDNYALKALESSSSPPPPPKAITHFLREGVVFNLSGED